MSKLSEPVAKALRKLLNACKGDTKVVSRVITGNYGPEEYFFNLKEEINLLRSKSAPYDSIVLALAQFIASSDAPKATEQPSAAAAVEGLEGILTEEELKERNRLLVLENDALNSENLKLRHTLKSAKYYLERDAHLPAEKIINEVLEELK